MTKDFKEKLGAKKLRGYVEYTEIQINLKFFVNTNLFKKLAYSTTNKN